METIQYNSCANDGKCSKAFARSKVCKAMCNKYAQDNIELVFDHSFKGVGQ